MFTIFLQLPSCPFRSFPFFAAPPCPSASLYNSSSLPGWMSRHTRRRTSTQVSAHGSPPQAQCTATFRWDLLCTWQANLRTSHGEKLPHEPRSSHTSSRWQWTHITGSRSGARLFHSLPPPQKPAGWTHRGYSGTVYMGSLIVSVCLSLK